MWRNEYLLSLRERQQTELKCGRIVSPFMPKIGNVVLIKEDLPRGRWNMGRIVDSVKIADGNVRSLKVKLKTGRVIGHPLNLLFPIEVSHNGCVFLVTKRRTPLPRLRLIGTRAFLYRLTPSYADHMTEDR